MCYKSQNYFIQNRGKIALVLYLVLCAANSYGKSNLETSGDIIQITIPSIACVTTYLLHDTQGRTQFYKSFILNQVITQILKRTVNKARPEENGDYSFPSGHTSASFQGASFIQRRYGWSYGIPAYAAAAYVGWSRIEGESDKHDLLDVTAGALIGIASSYIFTDSFSCVSITPTVNKHEVGLSLVTEW